MWITYKGQKGGGISSLRDIPSSAQQAPEQAGVAGFVLSVGPNECLWSAPAQIIMWF